MVEHSRQPPERRAFQLAVDICAVGSLLCLIASVCGIILWLTTPYSGGDDRDAWLDVPLAVDWLFSLPMALIFLLLALLLLALCAFLDAKLHRLERDLGS